MKKLKSHYDIKAGMQILVKSKDGKEVKMIVGHINELGGGCDCCLKFDVDDEILLIGEAHF